MLKGKKILLGISGSIAAYKSAILVRLLIKAGAEVKVILTPSATQFVAPLTLSTLSKNDTYSELSTDHTWSNHVMLGRWADVMLIAPLSCNTLSKVASGACDNLLMAVYLSSVCKVVVAPAMDEDMWLHPSTQKNINTIISYGNEVIPVESGELASGLIGHGRMAEPENIVRWLNQYFESTNDLLDKKIMITAGPTYEKIDPVRFIGNYSSGKMGIALANECKRRGANVVLICGPMTQQIPEGIEAIQVESADEMYEACHRTFPLTDIAVFSAAVADFKVKQASKDKIKKTESESFVLELERNKDILQSIGAIKKADQIVVGFALETNNEAEHAKEKLKKKNADLIVLNSLNDVGAGFGHDTNKITIFDKKGNVHAFDQKSKVEVAKDIVNTIINYTHV
jgi:phosphopantothenoylcysteine decarboxylase/phosphopantothenate--cysteine ligase